MSPIMSEQSLDSTFETNTNYDLEVSFSGISEISFISEHETEENIHDSKMVFDELEIQNENSNTTNFILSEDFEKFIENIGDMLSKSQYILYDLNGNKLCLEKNSVVYESDKNGNRQYYMVSNDMPLFQSPEMIIQYKINNP